MFALTTLTKYAGVGALVLGGLSLPAGADETGPEFRTRRASRAHPHDTRQQARHCVL
jgi:hypothetical protein